MDAEAPTRSIKIKFAPRKMRCAKCGTLARRKRIRNRTNGMWNRDTLTVIPSWRMVIASRDAKPGKFEPGEEQGQYNQNLSLIAQSVGGDARYQK